MHPQSMNLEEALRVTDAVVFAETGKHLNDAQRAVIEGTWQGETYEKIAGNYHCTSRYLKQDVGPKLWQIFYNKLRQKVTKKNFRTTLELLDADRVANLFPSGIHSTSAEPHHVSIPGGEVPTFRESAEELSLGESVKIGANAYIDWGEAPDISLFYGRTEELAQLEGWVIKDRCRLVALLGMGGIGKTSLSVKLTQQLEGDFEYIIWRSLRNAPSPNQLLAALIQFFSREQNTGQIQDLNRQFLRLIEQLRQHRCLIILDNYESILQERSRVGFYRQGYEDYGELLKWIGTTSHQSCLVVTSREKPKEIAAVEGERQPVRSLNLMGIKEIEGREILQTKGLSGNDKEWQQLIARYAGNPLALKIVTTTIHELFSGNIAEFLAQIEQRIAVFGDIRDLLEQQLRRVSDLEREVMYWLAINREPITLSELQTDMISPVSQAELIESLESLSRRSLIEINAGYFTQQPVVMEYMIAQFIEQIIEEIRTDKVSLLMQYALIKAQTKDYIRESQIRIILQPIAERLLTNYKVSSKIELQLSKLLEKIRDEFGSYPGYGGGNIINLCILFELDLTGYDFSRLAVWQAYLQDTSLHNVNFAEADLSKSVFAKTLGNSLTVALDQDGKLATGDEDGKVLLWQVADGIQLITCQGHSGCVKSVAFSHQGKLLASCSDDQTVKLWDVNTGECLKTLTGHAQSVNCICFSPDGKTLASASNDESVRLWDTRSGQCLHILTGHTQKVVFVAFDSHSRTLASSSDDQTLRLWDITTGQCLRSFRGNSNWFSAVAFAEQSDSSGKHGKRAIASSIDEQTIKLWDINTGQCCRILKGHQDLIWAVAFSQDGKILASSSNDQTTKVWQVSTGTCLKTLPGFDSRVSSLALSPNGQVLAIGGVERLVQLWDLNRGQRLRTLRGQSSQVWSFALSPDGQTLASGNGMHSVRLWDLTTDRALKTLSGHRDWVCCVSFSPHGTILASGSFDRTVKLWHVRSGECLLTLSGHTDQVQAVTFSTDGCTLASASDDQTVKLWDINSGECLHTLRGHTRLVNSIAFSPNHQILASGSDDQTVKLWDVNSGECLKTLEGHDDRVRTLTFSPDGQNLASCGYDQTVKVWEVSTGQCLTNRRVNIEQLQAIFFKANGQLLVSGSDEQTLRLGEIEDINQSLKTLPGHTCQVWSVSFSLDGRTLVSSSCDQVIKLWDVETGGCCKTLRIDKPYNGMNITNSQGITAATRAILKALGAVEYS